MELKFYNIFPNFKIYAQKSFVLLVDDQLKVITLRKKLLLEITDISKNLWYWFIICDEN